MRMLSSTSSTSDDAASGSNPQQRCSETRKFVDALHDAGTGDRTDYGIC